MMIQQKKIHTITTSETLKKTIQIRRKMDSELFQTHGKKH